MASTSKGTMLKNVDIAAVVLLFLLGFFEATRIETQESLR